MQPRKYILTSWLSFFLPALALGPGTALTDSMNRPADAIEYGTTVSGDTLWSIAANVTQSKSVTLEQAMVTLFRTNQHAFAEPNIHRLQLEQVIWVPTRRDFMHLSPEEALAEVLRHNQRHAELTAQAEIALMPPEATLPEAPLEVPPLEETALTEVVPADALVTSAPGEPVPPPSATTPRLQTKQESSTNTMIYLGIAIIVAVILYLLWRRRRQSHLAALSGASLDAAGSEVDLARAYIEMGDKTAAIGLLRSVQSKGSAAEVAEANELLKNL